MTNDIDYSAVHLMEPGHPGKWKDLTLTGLEMVSVTEQALFPLFPQRMAECIRE